MKTKPRAPWLILPGQQIAIYAYPDTAPRAVAHLADHHRLMSPTSALGRAWRTRNEDSGFTAATHAAR